MTEQLALTGDDTLSASSNQRPLRPRQQLAWDHVRTHDGVTADEVGALLHSQPDRKRPHPADERCDWCRRDGRSVLRAMALRPLVTGRRDGRWYVRNPEDRIRSPDPARREPTEAELQANPFAGL